MDFCISKHITRKISSRAFHNCTERIRPKSFKEDIDILEDLLGLRTPSEVIYTPLIPHPPSPALKSLGDSRANCQKSKEVSKSATKTGGQKSLTPFRPLKSKTCQKYMSHVLKGYKNYSGGTS